MTNKARYPFPLFVYPTRRCNFACSYCFTESDLTWPATSFLLQHWHDLVQQAASLSVPEIRLSGGEPLLIGNLDQLCKTVTTAGMSYTVTTNGSLFKRHVDWMVENPPQTIWLSFHAGYSTRERFLAQVAEVARHLPIIGVNLFDIDIVADPNLPVEAAIAGARRIKIVHRTPIGRHTGPAGGKADGTIKALRLVLRSTSTEPPELRVETPVESGTPVGAKTCVLIERPLLSIDYDGAVYPCCVTLGRPLNRVGDLRIENLATVVARAAPWSRRLPCADLLPTVEEGKAACPLSFTH